MYYDYNAVIHPELCKRVRGPMGTKNGPTSQNMGSISVVMIHTGKRDFRLKYGGIWPQLIEKNPDTYNILRELWKATFWMHPF